VSLNNLPIKSLKPKEKVYKVLDGEGLYIEVRPSGKKYWRYRFNIKSKQGIFTIGLYPEVSLAEARESRTWASAQARKGISLNVAKKHKEALEYENLFSDIANEYFSK
jgi:hypothetical protein